MPVTYSVEIGLVGLVRNAIDRALGISSCSTPRLLTTEYA